MPEQDSSRKHNDHRDDHKSHHKKMVQDFKRKFWISLILTIPVLVLSPMIQGFLNFRLEFPGDSYILFALSSIIFFYGGWPFLKGLVNELKDTQPGMMTLIALAITVAYVYSSLVVFGLKGKVFFWELVTLVDVMLLGHWIEMKSVMGASMALEKLARMMPTEAHRIKEDGSTEDVKIEHIQKGDKVLVKPGDKIPVDGKVIDGESEVNEAMITGESKPIQKSKDDDVIGGAINGSGSLTVKVTKTGQESYLAQVVNLVKEAGKSKSRAQNIANKAAFWLTVIAVSVGLITLIAWLIFGKDFVFALQRMVTVMVITCPHALGLAVPLVIAVITSLSAQNGLLIRNRTAFEASRKMQTVVFDKTGTLTKGQFGVTDIMSLGDWSQDDILKKAAAVETNSEHTIAAGIVNKAKEKNFKIDQVKNFDSVPGKGAKGDIGTKTVYVGNEGIIEKAQAKATDINEKIQKFASEGKTVVLVVADKKIQGLIALADIIRDESRQAVDDLKAKGIEVTMITGDNQATAAYVADRLGLDEYFAEVLPDKKSEKIKELQKAGKKVTMVGDGVNDAPALAQADYGIAIGAGTDVAAETADIILVESDPRNVADVVSLSKLTHKKMLQNLGWATGYNVIAIPLAAGVLYSYGIVLPPAIGALIMSASTVIVAVNAKLIKYDKQKNQ